MKKAARKIISILLVTLFTAQNVLCVELPSPSYRNSDKLAPPSLFQSSFAREDSPEYKNSVISDISLTTALFSIAFNYLEDRPESQKNEDLGIILRNEFRNNKPTLDALKNIDLENIKFDDDIVTIPVAYGGKSYDVRICSKDRFTSVDKTGSEWALSARFAIQASEKKHVPVKKARALSPLKEKLASDGDINYWDTAIAEAAKSDPKSVKVKVLLERGENRLRVEHFNIPSELLSEDNIDTCVKYLTASIYNAVVCEGAANIVVFMDDKALEKKITDRIRDYAGSRHQRMRVYGNFGGTITINDSSNFRFTVHKELIPRLDFSPESVKDKYYMGIDVGGTNIKVVIMYDNNDEPEYVESIAVDKDTGGVKLKEQILKCAEAAKVWLEKTHNQKVVTVGLTFPSPILIKPDGTFKVIRLTNFERFWSANRGGAADFSEDYEALNSIAADIKNVTGADSTILNDADAFGFGEIYNRIRNGTDPKQIGTKIVLPIGTGPGYVKIKDGYIENIPNQGGHMVIDLSDDANIDPGCEVSGCYGGYVPASVFKAMAKKHDLTETDLDNPRLIQKTSELLDDIAEKIAAESVKLYKITGANEIILAGGVSQKATGEELSKRANVIIREKYAFYADKVKVTVSNYDARLGGAIGAARYAVSFIKSLEGRNHPKWSMKHNLPATEIGKNNVQAFFDAEPAGKCRLLISRELFSFMMNRPRPCAWLGKLVDQNAVLFLDEYKTPDAFLGALSREDFSTMVAFGGGTLTDWAKFGAKKLGKEMVVIPSTLSTNGMFTEKAIFYPVIDGERKRDSAESGPPDRVIIDVQLLKDILALKSRTGIDAARANRAGSGDLVSIYPAFEDWRLAAKNGKEAIDDVIYEAGEEILRLTSENAEEMSANSDLGMVVLSETMAEASLLNMRYGTSRPKDGSEHLLADRMDSLLPASTPRLHCEMVGIASIIMGYLYGNEYDRKAFHNIRDLVKRLGLPTNPAQLGLTKEIIVEALTSIKTRPDKYTFFDAPEGKITRLQAELIYERLFGAQQNEIDEFAFDVNYYVNNSIKAMFEHINGKVIPNLDAEKTKELLELLLETKKLGGRVIINAAGRIGEVVVFFQQKLRALGFQVDDLKEITPEFLINPNDLVLTFSGSGSTISVVNNLKNVDTLHRERKLKRRIFSITAKPGVDTWRIGSSYHSVMEIKGAAKDDVGKDSRMAGSEYLPLSSTFEYSTALYLEGIVEALIDGEANGVEKDKSIAIVKSVIEKTPATIKDELREKLRENEPATASFIDYLLSAIEINPDGKIKTNSDGNPISKKRIYLFGLGQNNYVIRLFARRMQNIGFEVYVPGPRDIVSRPHKGDIAILVSNSGARGQMMDKFVVAKEWECPTICITAEARSPLAAASDLKIQITKMSTATHTADIMSNDDSARQARHIKRTFELASMFYLEGVSVALMKVLGITDKDLQHVPKEWELKGPEAPSSNPVIEKLIMDGKVAELALEEGAVKAYQVNYVNGYTPGLTDPNEYRGPPLDITNILTEDEIAELEKWINTHKFENKPVKFRIALRTSALGWNNDIDHSNIAHAGERDKTIYIGQGLLRYILTPGNEKLREEVLDKDEFQHLQGRGHGTDQEYKARLSMVEQIVVNLDAKENIKQSAGFRTSIFFEIFKLTFNLSTLKLWATEPRVTALTLPLIAISIIVLQPFIITTADFANMLIWAATVPPSVVITTSCLLVYLYAKAVGRLTYHFLNNYIHADKSSNADKIMLKTWEGLLLNKDPLMRRLAFYFLCKSHPENARQYLEKVLNIQGYTFGGYLDVETVSSFHSAIFDIFNKFKAIGSFDRQSLNFISDLHVKHIIGSRQKSDSGFNYVPDVLFSARVYPIEELHCESRASVDINAKRDVIDGYEHYRVINYFYVNPPDMEGALKGSIQGSPYDSDSVVKLDIPKDKANFLRIYLGRQDITEEDTAQYNRLLADQVVQISKALIAGAANPGLTLKLSDGLRDAFRKVYDIEVPYALKLEKAAVILGKQIESAIRQRKPQADIAVQPVQEVKIEKQATEIPDEPLIGHGFTAQEIDEAVAKGDITITPWNQSPKFKADVAALEKRLREDAPRLIPQVLRGRLFEQMLAKLEAFKAGREDDETRYMGICRSRYVDARHCYAGLGTSKNKALGEEYYTPGDPLSEFSEEALFHELFHAVRSNGTKDEDAKNDLLAHFDAMRYQAILYWGVEPTPDAIAHIWGLKASELKDHEKNRHGQALAQWKIRQSRIPERMAQDEWKELLDTLQFVLGGIGRNNNHSNNSVALLKELLEKCDEQTKDKDNWRYPIESRYPILRAASLLSKKDKMLLLNTLIEPKNSDILQLAVSDSIVLMLLDILPKETVDKILSEWIDRQAPYVKGRRVWKFAAEIWNAAGGLGRVLQFHGTAMHEILLRVGVPLVFVEPRYYRNKQGHKTDYNRIFGIDNNNPQDKPEKEIMRFNVRVGNDDALAVCYLSIKDGLELYTIEGFKKGQDPAKDVPYYTEQCYNYRQYWTHPDQQHLVAREEFSVFIALAMIELSRRVEEGIRNKDGDTWKEPILHWNDGQMGFGPYFLKKRYENDPIFAGALVAFTTHTYFNRQFFVQREGWDKGNETEEEKFLRLNGIDVYDEWLYFHHRMDMWGDDAHKAYQPVCDESSAGLRAADWRGGVAHEHVQRLYRLGYDTYKDIRDKGINVEMIGVTNGDRRTATAQEFDKALSSVCAGKLDSEELTYKQVFAAKMRSKDRLNKKCNVNIDPKRPVLEYSGRGVSEKSGGQRALTNNNIIELVKMGVQVVIGCNSQAEKNIVENWEKLVETIRKLKTEKPNEYTGNFILIKDSNVEIQRYILAAADVQVQDSDPITEAAGFCEADIFACCGIQIAPPWNEGNLQSCGVPLNFDNYGEGNVLRPDIKILEDSYKKLRKPYDVRENETVESAYLALYKRLFSIGRNVDEFISGKNMEKTLEVLARYGATSRRLSRVLESRLTAAEELRQWSSAIKEKSIRRTGKAPLLEKDVQPAKSKQIEVDMEAIHKLNMDCYPPVEGGKTLYEVVPLELIPVAMRTEFVNMVTRLNQEHPELQEKIEIVNDRQDLVGRITELASDPNNIVTAAVANKDCLNRLPQGVKALLFKNEDGGVDSFKEIECILAALRALYQDDARTLIRLYEIASGEKFAGDEAELLNCMNDPSALARKIIFSLKSISIENKEMLDRLNGRVIELIRQSA